MTLTPELHTALEAELQQLAVQVGERMQQKNIESQSALREIVGERIQQAVPTPIVPVSTDAASTPISSVLPAYANEMPADQRLVIERLVDSFFHQGNVIKAIEEAAAYARSKKSPEILDVFHDTLTGKMHDVLKERALL